MSNRLGAFAALLGPALLLSYYWSEAAFGPSQPNGGPLRMATGFTLITGALVCFAVALLRMRDNALEDHDRVGRFGMWLGYLAIGFLALGTMLWWPVLFVWPEYGPLAGAPVALGAFSLFGMWLLVGLRAARDSKIHRLARLLPLALLGVLCMVFYVTGSASAWPILVVVLTIFALSWVLMAYVIFRPGTQVIAAREQH
jgi:hypothetical protein